MEKSILNALGAAWVSCRSVNISDDSTCLCTICIVFNGAVLTSGVSLYSRGRSVPIVHHLYRKL